MNNNDDNSKVVCKWVNCNIEFNNSEDLFFHVINFHIGKGANSNLTCGWSGCTDMIVHKRFKKRDNAISHIRKHIKYFPYNCNHCSRNFRRPQDLRKHFLTTHANSSSNTQCSEHNIRVRPYPKISQFKQTTFSMYDNSNAISNQLQSISTTNTASSNNN
eukprot:Pgem_evm1s9949